MIDYLQQLRNDFESGKLLMDCIVLDAYNWLVVSGYLPADDFLKYTVDAATYRMAQIRKFPRTLQDSLKDPFWDMEKKHQFETTAKENIAKKMAVYTWVGDNNVVKLLTDAK